MDLAAFVNKKAVTYLFDRASADLFTLAGTGFSFCSEYQLYQNNNQNLSLCKEL
jgi:hypothetical protein